MVVERRNFSNTLNDSDSIMQLVCPKISCFLHFILTRNLKLNKIPCVNVMQESTLWNGHFVSRYHMHFTISSFICLSLGLIIRYYTRLGVDRVKPWNWVRINLGLGLRGTDIGPGLDNRHYVGFYCQPQSQSLSSGL